MGGGKDQWQLSHSGQSNRVRRAFPATVVVARARLLNTLAVGSRESAHRLKRCLLAGMDADQRLSNWLGAALTLVLPEVTRFNVRVCWRLGRYT